MTTTSKRSVLLELGICWSGGPKKTRTYGVALYSHPGMIVPLVDGLKSRKEAKEVLKKLMANFEDAYAIKRIEEITLCNPLLRDLLPMFRRVGWIKKEKS